MDWSLVSEHTIVTCSRSSDPRRTRGASIRSNCRLVLASIMDRIFAFKSTAYASFHASATLYQERSYLLSALLDEHIHFRAGSSEWLLWQLQEQLFTRS